jgi:hypothetical protein
MGRKKVYQQRPVIILRKKGSTKDIRKDPAKLEVPAAWVDAVSVLAIKKVKAERKFQRRQERREQVNPFNSFEVGR